MLSNIELVAFAKKAKAEGWGYVWGAQGELYTPELAKIWARTRNKSETYYTKECAKWFGRYVVDCSGTIIAAFRDKNPKYKDQSANYLFSQCKAKGDIKDIPEIPGLIVWKKGHIGVYIGNGQAIESRGTKYGVVQTTVSKRPWTHWGKLADVGYSEIIESEENDMLNINNAEEVYEYQHICKRAGHDPLKPGATWEDMKTGKVNGCDGSYGPYMTDLTKKIQKQHGLTLTGIPDNMTMLKVASDIEGSDKAAMDKLKAANTELKAHIQDIKDFVKAK